MTYKEMLEKAAQNQKTEILTPKFHEWTNEGQELIGQFKSRSSVTSQQSDVAYYQYLFETDEGLVKFHLGRATDGEAGSLMEPGQVYHIVYLGQEKIGNGRRVNKFHVEHIIL